MARRIEASIGALRAANRQLAERNEEVERTSRQIALFARAVSHDLRSPVTAACEALRLARSAPSERAGDLVALAEESVHRADRMLTGLRDYLRALGTQSPRRPVDVEAIVEEVVAELRAEWGAEPPVRILGRLGTVRGRDEALSHVLRNLLSNAIRHNRERSRLRVEVGREPSATPTFFVRDNGGGIRFAQPPSPAKPIRSRRSPDDGLGLGLELVDAIVRQEGGKVWIESLLGCGTTVRFSVPQDGEGDGG